VLELLETSVVLTVPPPLTGNSAAAACGGLSNQPGRCSALTNAAASGLTRTLSRAAANWPWTAPGLAFTTAVVTGFPLLLIMNRLLSALNENP
jgi:hypothetical protein